MKKVKLFEEFLNELETPNIQESNYAGNVSGDAAEYIAKELSQYVKGIIDQPNDKVTYFHLKDKSKKGLVIKTLKDVYALDATDGGTQFSPSPTIKFDNDVILESTKINEASTWDKVRAKSKEMFGEWVIDVLSEDDLAQLIDIPEADKIAKKYFHEYTFIDLGLDQMGELVNKYPKVVKESLDEALNIDASGYKRVHGKDPKGTGKWAFYFDKNERDVFFTPTAMSYGDALKWAKEQAKSAGKTTIYVGESLNEDFPGPGEIVDAKDLDYNMLDYFDRMNIRLLIDTKTKKGIKGSVGKMFGDLVFNGDSIDVKDIVNVKIVESNDSAINESESLMAFILIAQAAAIGGQIGLMVAKQSGDISPIEDLKRWWNDRKRDKAVQSIVAKLQSDPEIIEFMKLSPSQQKGKFRALVATKLTPEESDYLNRINRNHFQK
jgi:hypothetical protein